MAVKPIPDGYRAVTPYLTAENAAALLEFLRGAFGAQELERMERPDGSVQHAEVRIGDSVVMLGQPEAPRKATPSTLYLYVEDVDSTYERALKLGATSIQPVKDRFYGDRSGGVQDPAGNSWYIATHKENVSPEEMQRRSAALAKA